jgi:protein-disulfide isomerase
MHRILGVVIAAAAFCLACGTFGGTDADSPGAARVGDQVITVQELDASIKQDLFDRETGGGNASKVYELRSDALRDLVSDRVIDQEAARRGLTREQLLDAEFAALPPVTDEQIEAFYSDNADRLRGAPLDQLSPRIRSHLEGEARKRALDDLVAKADVQVLLPRPRVEVRPDGPSQGPDGAPVTIVEFSDFQCPFCQRAKPVLEEIVARHPEDVRVVYRHLPLDSIHPRARASAEAAACAADGGRFWEFHDLLFANQRQLGDEDLRRYASEVGLEPEAFDECVRSRRHAQAVEADVQEAQRIGLTGTPAFVVNGIVLFGLQSTDALDGVVLEELKRIESES